jgi:glycosyltransferase involved in cell wall biosynthesis
MKILILASGKSFHATRWANELSGRGYDICFVTIHSLSRPLDKKIHLVKMPNNFGLGYIFQVGRLKSILNNYKPDILHAHYSTGYGLMSKLSGFSKNIVSIYGTDAYDFPHKSLFHKFLLKSILKGHSAKLSTSENMASEISRTYPDLSRPIVTPFGVDINLFKPADKRACSRDIKIGVVKKMDPKYGIDILLKSFSLYLKKYKINNATLHIAGDGAKLNEYKQLSKKLKIDEFTTFYGVILNSQVPEFLNSLDIFVVPSQSESFGVAAVEAQSCALPVIVSNVGGLPEVVKDGYTGIVVKVGDIEGFSTALNKLGKDLDLRKELGANGRKRVERLYDWSKNVDLMERIYCDIS